MGSLEELTGKIIEDGKIQAQKIIDEAIESSKRELEEETKRIEHSCDSMIKEAEIKANEWYRQICAEKEIEIRDKNLFMKQKILDGIFSEAFEQLKNLDIEGYKELLKRKLLGKDLSNYILMIPDKYLKMQNELEHFLQGLFEKDKFPMKVDYKPLAGGFILVQDGIEENYTFESWIDLIRQEIEREVLDILYREEN